VKYFKTNFVPAVKTNSDKRTLVDRSTELLCLAENTFEPVYRAKKKLDFALFKNAKTLTAIIYDEDVIPDACAKLNKIDFPHKTAIYVFSYDQDYDASDFSSLQIKFTVKPIPEAILNVYRKNAKLRKK
jgi:adenine-specific DNA-methyltransferase